MLLLAAIAAAATPVQARASVRIVKAQRINRDEWERSRRKREIVLQDGGSSVAVRLIELE